MSVAPAETVLARPDVDPRPLGLRPAPVRSRPRGTGPGVGPSARPRRLRFTTPPVPPRQPQACAPAPRTVPEAPGRPRSWRLTDRGLAVVLVVAAALVAASVAVVGLTALRVTGDGYRAGESGVVLAVAQP